MLATLQNALSNNGGRPLEVDLQLVGRKDPLVASLTAFDQHGIVIEREGQVSLVPWHQVETLHLV